MGENGLYMQFCSLSLIPMIPTSVTTRRSSTNANVHQRVLDIFAGGVETLPRSLRRLLRR